MDAATERLTRDQALAQVSHVTKMKGERGG